MKRPLMELLIGNSILIVAGLIRVLIHFAFALLLCELRVVLARITVII